jgi:hypothetical protein
VPNPRNYPGTSVKRSTFDTVKTSSRGFKKFTRSVEAFAKPSSAGHPAAEAFSQFQQSFEQSLPPTPIDDPEFQGLGHKVIEIVTPKGNEARVHLTGFSPFQQDDFGILKAVEGVIIEEVREMVTQEIDEEAQSQMAKSTTTSTQPDLMKFAKKGSQSK